MFFFFESNAYGFLSLQSIMMYVHILSTHTCLCSYIYEVFWLFRSKIHVNKGKRVKRNTLTILRNQWKYHTLNHWSFESTCFYASSAEGCPFSTAYFRQNYEIPCVIHLCIELNFKFRNTYETTFEIKNKCNHSHTVGQLQALF